MGNAASTQDPACVFLQDVPAKPAQLQQFFESYVRSSWRAERARELDALGGLNREPLARGQSMSAKLKYLEEHLQRQQREMQEVLAPVCPPAKADEPAVPPGSLPWVMHTDVRAAHRVQQTAQRADPADAAPEPPRWGSPTPEELIQRRQQQLLRSKMLSFARSLPSPTSELSPGREKASIQETRYRYSGRLRSATKASIVVEVQPVAAWRIRVHAARRRLFLVILAVVRLQRGLNHPRRLRRVDSFSYCIPLALGNETPRFVEELVACQQASAALQEAQSAFIATSEFEPVVPHTRTPALHRSATLPVRHNNSSGNPLQASAHDGLGPLCSPRVSLVGEPHFPPAGPPSSLVSGSLPSGHGMFDQRMPSACGSALGSAYLMSLGGSSHCSSLPTTVANSSHGGSSAACSASVGGSSSHESRLPSCAGGQALDDGLLETHLDTTALTCPVDQDTHSELCDTLDMTPPQSLLAGDSSPAVGVLSMSVQGPLEALATRDAELSSRSSLMPDMTPTPGRVLRQSVSVPARSTRFNSLANKLVPPLPPKVAMPPKAPTLVVNSARRQPVLPPISPAEGPMAPSIRSCMVSPARSSASRVRSSLDSTRPGSSHRNSLEARMELLHVAEVQSAAVARGIGMMAMYLNRVNGAWAESCSWRPGVMPLQALSELEAFAASENFPVYKADLIRLLRQGQVVWHINTEDVLHVPSSHGVDQHVPLWCADPWQLLAAARPGSLPLGTRLEGISMGGRSLAQLTSAVESLAGPEAVRNLSLVLQVPTKWKSIVTQDLVVHRMYGLNPHRVYLVESPDWPGYVWDSITKTWVRSTGSEAAAHPTDKDSTAQPDSHASSRSRRSSRAGAVPATALATPKRGTLTQLGRAKLATKPASDKQAGDADHRQRDPDWMHVTGPGGGGESWQDADQQGMSSPCLDQAAAHSVRSLGAGFGLMQCAWPDEAVQLLPTPVPTEPRADHGAGLTSTAPEHAHPAPSQQGPAARDETRMQMKETRLQVSLWETLQANQVEWMISLRSRDMVLLGRDGGPVDVATLPYILYMRDKARITMSVLGVHASQVQARQADSVILMQAPASSQAVPRANLVERQKWLLPGRVGDKAVELRCCELGGGSQMAELQNGWRPSSGSTGSSPDMGAALSSASTLAVGLQRYVFHLPSLVTAVSQANAFRPKLLLSGTSVHVSHEISDLTSHPSMTCLALAAPVRGCGPTSSTISSLVSAAEEEGEVTQVARLPLLTRVADLDELVPLLCKQDSHKWVRKWASLAGGRVVIGTGSSSTAAGNPKPSSTSPARHQLVDRSQASVQVLAGYEELVEQPGSEDVPAAAAAAAKAGLKAWSGEVLADHPLGDPTTSPLAHALATAAELRRAKRAALGQHLVVFLVPNNVAQLAVNLAVCMARPCLDRVHLVTVVARAEHESQALQHLHTFETKLHGAGVSCSTLVIVKGSGRGLLDCMQEAVETCRGGLVIMGSKALTSGAPGLSTAKAGGQGNSLQPQVIGSVTLSAIKRLDVPVAVVTTNTRNLAGACVPRSCMNAVALVEPQARPMVHYLASRCLDPLRGDRLLLVQQVPVMHTTLQQAAQQRRLMESFADAASEHHMPPSDKVVLTGDSANKSQLLDLLQSETIQLVGLQVSRGSSSRVLPAHLLQLLGSSQAAVLVHKESS